MKLFVYLFILSLWISQSIPALRDVTRKLPRNAQVETASPLPALRGYAVSTAEVR
jgi:hypothetical protein